MFDCFVIFHTMFWYCYHLALIGMRTFKFIEAYPIDHISSLLLLKIDLKNRKSTLFFYFLCLFSVICLSDVSYQTHFNNLQKGIYIFDLIFLNSFYHVTRYFHWILCSFSFFYCIIYLLVWKWCAHYWSLASALFAIGFR